MFNNSVMMSYSFEFTLGMVVLSEKNDILSKLESIPGMTVSWYFHEDDEDMEEAGTEFSELVEVPFEFKTY